MTAQEKFEDYLKSIKKPFIKICRLRFLDPNGFTSYIVDSNPLNRNSKALIQSGNISVNFQNGTRRTASVTLTNLDGEFEYSADNGIWLETEVALDEGIILSSGEEYYIQQGIFVIVTPESALSPDGKTITLSLTDKWANLDGSLFGNLEGTYKVDVGTNVYEPITEILALDRGNGLPVDSVTPVYTRYYDGKTQTLQDGTTVLLTDTPYTIETEGTYADVILGLTSVLNACVGYDSSGALRVDPSQDDILDTTKPVQYDFSMGNTVFLGATYKAENTKIYNDYIIVGQALDGYPTPSGRATNFDPSSDTNVNLIGRKTYREDKNGYVTKTQCEDLAAWKLKRTAALQNSVDISCSQILHIKENEIVTIRRTDKKGAPVENHLVIGFSRPLVGTSPMTVSCVSVTDFPIATITHWP